MTRALDATRAVGTDKTGLAHPTTRRSLLWRGLVAVPAGAAVLAIGADSDTPIAAMRREVLRLAAVYRGVTSDAEAEAALDAELAIKRKVAAGVHVRDTTEAICALQWVTAEAREEDMPDGAMIALLAGVVAMMRRARA